MIGKSILHYRIIEKLGEGGMGEVYLAEDTKLQRTVALKFLPSELISDREARKRFIQEAIAASALDHPNIGTIYEINETEANPFISMAYYDGQTLKEKIENEQMDVKEVLQVAIKVADGLAKAHKQGIIHRDIKPANIIFTKDGEIKIIDFGLAKLSGRSVLTRAGATMGTISYMSPEQLLGNKVDYRTDIWALGVVLYEMLAGSRPFQAEYEQAIMYSIAHEDPEFISSVRSDVPANIEKIIDKALNKNPQKRFAAISEMQQALQQVTDDFSTGNQTPSSAKKLSRKQLKLLSRVLMIFSIIFIMTVVIWYLNTTESGPVSIALLPLENISAHKDQEWFTDGMTDALITNLASLSGLRIISRSSIMKYKETDKSAKEIAAELGVAYIIEGSVIKIDDQVKITTRLIDAKNNDYMWAHEYNRDFKNLLSLQGEVARAIAGQIRINLTPFEQKLLTAKHDVIPEAYEVYLRGKFSWHKLTREGIESAVNYFNMAVEIDPEYAQAYIGIALSHLVKAQMGYESLEEVEQKAEPAILKAMELDSTLAEVYYFQALMNGWVKWQWRASLADFKKAIMLNPNMAEARAYYSHALFIGGYPEQQGMQQIERALQLDPFNALFQALYGMALMYARQYDQVIEMLEKTLLDAPGNPITLSTLRSAYHQKKMYDQAIRIWRKSFEAGKDLESMEVLNKGLQEGGYMLALQRVAEHLIERSKKHYVTPWQIATLFTRAGKNDLALDWLEKALDVHDPNMPYINIDPIFDDLRQEPRFQNLIKKVGL